MHIALRVYGKNRVILLVMFTPRVMFIKMLKITYFMHSPLKAQNQSQFGQAISVHLNSLI